MSDINLTEAVDAAAQAVYEMRRMTATTAMPTWDELTPLGKTSVREQVVYIVSAAAPHIESPARAAERARIIDALEDIDSNDWAWRSMDVNTGTVVAQWIRDGLVLPPIGDDDE